MTRYCIRIDYKENKNSNPKVTEIFKYRNKFFRWWKRYIDTVDMVVTTQENGCFTRYIIKPYFTEWSEND